MSSFNCQKEQKQARRDLILRHATRKKKDNLCSECSHSRRGIRLLCKKTIWRKASWMRFLCFSVY